MPELPEVESVIQSLRTARPSIIGRSVKEVRVVWDGVVSNCQISLFQQQLAGAVFVSAERRGKYMLFGMDCEINGLTKRCFLINHLRMTGRLTLVSESEAVAQHTRFSLILDQGRALRFDDPRKFGRVWLVDEPAAVIGNLGPDALSISSEQFAQRWSGYHRQLKPLLLDQSFVAGIGNIYADESLFRARLHPLGNSRDLSGDEIRVLYEAVHSVLSEAVAANGANIDGVFKAGNFQVNVYGRQGQLCPMCGAVIVKTRVAQRGTHFCPSCQELR